MYQMKPDITEVFKGGVSVSGKGSQRIASHTSVPSSSMASQLKVISEGIPSQLPDYPAGHDQAPHAPRRPVELTPELCEQAVKNAIRYFPEHMHQVLAPEFAEELKTYDKV